MSNRISVACNEPNRIIISIGDVDLFFSYKTLVAARTPTARYRTSERYSVTTSKHLGLFGVKDWPQLAPDALEDFATSSMSEQRSAA